MKRADYPSMPLGTRRVRQPDEIFPTFGTRREPPQASVPDLGADGFDEGELAIAIMRRYGSTF